MWKWNIETLKFESEIKIEQVTFFNFLVWISVNCNHFFWWWWWYICDACLSAETALLHIQSALCMKSEGISVSGSLHVFLLIELIRAGRSYVMNCASAKLCICSYQSRQMLNTHVCAVTGELTRWTVKNVFSQFRVKTSRSMCASNYWRHEQNLNWYQNLRNYWIR